MQLSSKLQLSKQETELIKNTQWILTKHSIIKKVCEMFGLASQLLTLEAEPYDYLFHENIQYRSGKISRGENYQMLPYVILDHPSFFEKDNIFVMRTMFWWGNFFSVTLHLRGSYKNKFLSNSRSALLFMQKHNFFICINSEEWQHHFKNDNYKNAGDITLPEFEKTLENKFFKISKNIPVADWNSAPGFIVNTFREILQFLSDQLPSR